MDSIGEKLRSIREQKKITIRDVAKDTNISASYIQALEDEDFDKFPGETYLIGFLRSYSDYLKLDAEEIIQAYKGYKIGESATPLEELTKPTHSVISVDINSFYSKYKKIINLSVIGLVFLLIIVFISQLSSPDIDLDENDTNENIKKQYSEDKNNGYSKILGMDIDPKTLRGSISASRDEAIQFRVDSKEIMFILKDVSKNSVQLEFLLQMQKKQVETLMVEQPKVIKLPGISRDITFNLQATTANRAKIKVILAQAANNNGEQNTQDVNNQQAEDSTLSTSMVALNPDNLRILLTATFVEKTYLDLYLDGKKMSSGLMPKGESRQWQAKQTIQVKVGNAGGMKININNKDFIFGQKGKVAHKIITWKKDNKNPNLYHIIIKDW